MVRAAQASPDHGFCGVSARAGSAPHSGARGAHGARTGRAALAAPKKKMQEGGAHFWGLDTAVSRGGGRTPAHLFRRGGSKIYYVEDLYQMPEYRYTVVSKV